MKPSDFANQSNAEYVDSLFHHYLRDLIEKLRITYCGNLGVEYIGISDKTQRDWLQEKMEPTFNRPNLTDEQAKGLMFQLLAAEEFEKFLAARNPGAKRFGLEGAE